MNPFEWRIVPSPKGSRFHIWDWLALGNAVKKESLDVFWSPANKAFPIRGIPQVVTIHDTLLQERVVHPDIISEIYYQLITPLFSRWFADRIITVSRFSGKRIGQIFRFPPKKTHIIYNGARLSTKTVTPKMLEKTRKTLGIPDKDYIYALGAESEWKNTLGLLEAFKHVLEKQPRIHLVVSGIQTRVMETVLKYCRQMDLPGESLTLLGFVSKEQRDCLYAGATLFVYPSLFEGFGLPPLEAMAMGTPVVASNAASIPEVVGNAALNVDASVPRSLAKGILSLLNDKILQTELIKNGDRNIHRFQWEISAKRHRSVMVLAIL